MAGIVSLVSLALLSFERYSVLLCKQQSDSCQYRRAWLAVAASWLYSLVWTVPPLLGWSRSANLKYSRPQRKVCDLQNNEPLQLAEIEAE